MVRQGCSFGVIDLVTVEEYETKYKDIIKNIPRGPEYLSHRSKLTADQVRDIRRRSVKGNKHGLRGNTKQLAEEYGISASALIRIINRVTYPGVKD